MMPTDNNRHTNAGGVPHCHIADSSAIDISGALTIEFWISFHDWPHQSFDVIAKSDSEQTYECRFRLIGADRAEWSYTNGGRRIPPVTILLRDCLRLHEWFHIVLVRQVGTMGAIYVDGLLCADQDWSGLPPPPRTRSPLRIVRETVDHGHAQIIIAGVYIFDRVKRPEELPSSMVSSKPPGTQPEAICYFNGTELGLPEKLPGIGRGDALEHRQTAEHKAGMALAGNYRLRGEWDRCLANLLYLDAPEAEALRERYFAALIDAYLHTQKIQHALRKLKVGLSQFPDSAMLKRLLSLARLVRVGGSVETATDLKQQCWGYSNRAQEQRDCDNEGIAFACKPAVVLDKHAILGDALVACAHKKMQLSKLGSQAPASRYYNVTYQLPSEVLITPDGRAVDEYIAPNLPLVHRRLFPRRPIQAFHRVESSSYLFSRMGSKNYYHWMVEMLPRLVDFDRAERDATRQAILLNPTQFQLDSILWCIEHEHLNVLSVKVINTPVPALITFADLVVPRFPYVHIWTQMAEAFFSEVGSKARSLVGGEPAQLKIYSVRGESKGSRVVNENRLIELFSDRGYMIVDNSKLSFEEQVGLFCRASVVAGVHGANLVNAALMGQGSAVFEILPTARLVPTNYEMACGMDFDYSCVFQEASEKDIEVDDQLVADIEALMDTCRFGER